MTDKEQQIKQLEHDLTNLKREIDRKLKENRIEIYNVGKVHKKQIEFHEDTHRIRALFGGNRTGKTVGGAVEAVCHALGYSRFKKLEPSSGWVVSLTNEVQRDVAQKEILKWLPKNEIKDYVIRHGRKDDPTNSIIDKIILKNGQTIGFKTCEQGRESFQGTSQGWIWFDEEPPEDIFQECQMRILDTRGDMWFTMTPLKGLTWVYNLVYLNEKNNPNIKYWMMEWEDNPWLSKEEIEQMCVNMSEEEREARQYGRFTSLCGFAFPEMRKEIHIVKPMPENPPWYKRFIAIDYGLDCTALIWIYVDEQGKARIYRTFSKKDLVVSDAAKKIKELSQGESIYAYLAPPDLFWREQVTGRDKATIFAENGVWLTKTSNSHEQGWALTHEWIKPYETIDEITGTPYKTANLTFDEGATEYLFKCLSNLQKDEKDPNDVDSKRNHDITHLPDALRCFCVYWISPGEKPKDKNKKVGKWTQDMLNDYYNADDYTRQQIIEMWGEPE